MAVGESAEPIYDLIEEIGNSPIETEKIFNELVRWMSGDDIKRFVQSVRHDWDLPEGGNKLEQEAHEWRGLTVYK